MDLTAGVRLEDNQRFGTYATYRLGVAYRLPGGTRVRATGGNAFREPSFFENYSTGFTTGNPDLKPEHSRSWEVGFEQSLAAGRASLSATFFDQRFLDMIDYNPNVPAGSPNYANVAAATANGVELGVRYAPVGPVWAGGAAVVVAVTAALVIPAAFGGGPSSCQDFPGAFCYDLRRH